MMKKNKQQERGQQEIDLSSECSTSRGIFSSVDVFHKLTIATMIGLVAITANMLVLHQSEAKNLQAAADHPKVNLKEFHKKKIANNNELYSEVIQMLEQEQYTLAGEKLEEIKKDHPDNPQSYVYQAQLQYGQGQIVSALYSYRIVIDIDTDYIDRITPLFMSPLI